MRIIRTVQIDNEDVHDFVVSIRSRPFKSLAYWADKQGLTVSKMIEFITGVMEETEDEGEEEGQNDD